MTKAVLLRIGHAFLSVFVLLMIVFAMLRIAGDPLSFVLSDDASPEQVERVTRELGLDEPIPNQFVLYVGRLASGDLGVSFRNRNSAVVDLIAQRVPATVAMALPALALTILVGVPLGIYSAYWRGGKLDRFARTIAAFGQAMPSFWFGFLLILVFAVGMRLLPPGGYGRIDHFVLPTLTLAFASIAGLIRLLRSAMIEELDSDYITFHRMKGLSERKVLWKHALRNAGLTTLGFVGVLTAGLFTGSVLVETIFTWPGIGRLMVDSIENRDFPVVQGVMLLFALTYIGVNLLVDVLYTVLNPRLR